jgi:hypothetical protein
VYQVRLATRDVLYEPGQRMRRIYFPESAVASPLAMTGDGETAEVAVSWAREAWWDSRSWDVNRP